MNTLTLTLLAALSAKSVYSSHYHGPTAKPVVLHNGYLADTHEVAAAKNAHLATLAKYSHGYTDSYRYSQGEAGHGNLRYHGPTAIPHILHDGHIADTHEVAAAKAKHLATVAKAYTHGGEYEGDYSGQYAGEHDGYSGHAVPYHGPLAKPVVLKSGYLADTHEVAAAKDEHLSTVAKAQSHGGEHEGDYSGQYAREHDGYSGHAVPYHGPLAKPVVLKSGYLADTHEVAAAKQHHLETLNSSHHKGYEYRH